MRPEDLLWHYRLNSGATRVSCAADANRALMAPLAGLVESARGAYDTGPSPLPIQGYRVSLIAFGRSMLANILYDSNPLMVVGVSPDVESGKKLWATLTNRQGVGTANIKQPECAWCAMRVLQHKPREGEAESTLAIETTLAWAWLDLVDRPALLS